MKRSKWAMVVQYSCAVLLIVSSILMAFCQIFDIQTIAHGTLMYIAQAFLLAGSIFGLEYYITKINAVYAKATENSTKGNQKL